MTDCGLQFFHLTPKLLTCLAVQVGVLFLGDDIRFAFVFRSMVCVQVHRVTQFAWQFRLKLACAIVRIPTNTHMPAFSFNLFFSNCLSSVTLYALFSLFFISANCNI